MGSATRCFTLLLHNQGRSTEFVILIFFWNIINYILIKMKDSDVEAGGEGGRGGGGVFVDDGTNQKNN